MQLSEQLHIPEQYHDACDRLHHLVQKHSRRLLSEQYWSEHHLQNIQHHVGHAYTYIREDDYDAFKDTDECLYSRFERCVYQRVTSILNSQTEKYNVFQFVLTTLRDTVHDEQKIRSVAWALLRHELSNYDEYIEWSILEIVVKQLNNYYDTHGQFPDTYTELITTPKPNGTLPYAPDKGDYTIHHVKIENNKVVFTMNAPDSLSPDGHDDWSEHTIKFPIHTRLETMLDHGEIKASTLHQSEHGYTLDLPVKIDNLETDSVDNRVLAIDLGVKKQATATVVEANNNDDTANTDDEYTQIEAPMFFDHPDKQKLFRLKNDAEGINNKLTTLRENGEAHTEQFEQLLAEYKYTRRKERRLRDQIQHDLANQLVWIALQYDCETIVFESLGQLTSADASGQTAWSISSWARGKLFNNVEYKCDLVGLDTDTVNPWGTSRHCPRCGEHGETLKAPDERDECRHGGHFHCSSCGYECDRDVVGSLNVARVFFDDYEQIETANPVAYMETGNHASFLSLVDSSARSTGVQSTTRTGTARSRQTLVSQHCSSPLNSHHENTKWCGTQGGLPINHSSNTGLQWPSSSILRHALARATGQSRILPNTTENQNGS